MDLSCPSCGAADVRRVSLVYREGTTMVDEQTGGVGAGVARGGLGVGVFGSKTQGTHKTLLARDLAPPQVLRLSGWAAMGVLAGLALYFGGLANPGAGILFGVLLAIPCARYLWRQKQWNQTELPKLVTRWESSFLCSRCGTVFTPGGHSTETTVPRPSIQQLSRGTVIAMVAAALAGIFVGSVSGRPESRSVAPAASADKRHGDSASAMQLMASLRVPATRTTADLFRFEDLVHGSHLTIPHDSLHVRAVTRRLDSADVLLRPNKDGWGRIAPAREQLNALYSPLTAPQQQRRAQLLRKALHQDSLLQQAALRATEATIIQNRREFAKRAESLFLDQGMDVEVTVLGRAATTLHMKYVLAGRVTAHQMSQNTDFFGTLRTMGFRRFELTDGYDFNWYWDLR